MDHRLLIQQYDLGHIEEHSPGLIHFHPNGQYVFNRLKEYMRRIHAQQDYQEVSSPQILHQKLWEQSGHWEKYKDLMFVAQASQRELYAIKPMSCPGQINIYKHARRSVRDLPMKLFEFGHVHRNEPSGSLSGWMRLRGFVQDDSHVFCPSSEIAPVIQGFIRMVEKVYRDFGFEKWEWRLSLRPEKRAGSDEVWDRAENALRQACAQSNIEAVEQLGEGAFYGPKLEVVLSDRLGRSWQCGVAQLDFVLPERFALSFQNHADEAEAPVIIHHAVLGSLERWLSIVMENQSSLPDWLCPQLVAVCPISQKHFSYAQEVLHRLKQEGVPCVLLEEGPLAGRLKHADEKGIPYRMVVGEREQQNAQVSLRRDHGPSSVLSLSDGVSCMKAQHQAP